MRTPRCSFRRAPSGTPPRGGGVATGLVAFCLSLLSGCGPSEDYPDHLAFKPRADRIVLRVPGGEENALEPAGELDQHLASIDAKGGQTIDLEALPGPFRERLNAALKDHFGTPARPVLKLTGPASGPAHQARAELKLDPETLAAGSMLFRRHCQQCHGMHGDGRGPTGLFIHPHPRDFRAGKFKYITSAQTQSWKPRLEDLERTLQTGLKGTSMPSFAELPQEQRSQMLRVVVHLSLRGQVERQILREAHDDLDALPDAGLRVQALLQQYLLDWQQAQHAPPIDTLGLEAEAEGTPPDPQAVARGYELFVAENGAGCLKCHADFGRAARYRYDEWGTLVRPMDLTAGIYRGGKSPAALYQRLLQGIGPSGMPSTESLTPQQRQDLVRFVQALPYPKYLPPQVRARVYPDLPR